MVNRVVVVVVVAVTVDAAVSWSSLVRAIWGFIPPRRSGDQFTLTNATFFSFLFLGQDQSTVAQRAETTEAESFLTSDV